MEITMRPLLAALVVSVAGFSMVNSAQAGCDAVPSLSKPSAWYPAPQESPMARSAYYRPEARGRFLPTGDDEASIVGMWRFQLTAPNGAVVDDGYAQWHSDGTEIQNSGLHAPITSNFCLGVWSEVGHGTYQLNHFPLAWDATGQSPANAIQLTETVKLTDHDHLTGTFKLKVYVWSTPDSLDVSPSTPVATVTGNITATRVTIYSMVPGSTQ
ncbi:MAG: hypothetical protein WB646_00570 [Steroidobacteraceae bacterium]